MEAVGIHSAGGGLESQRNMVLALITANFITAVLGVLLYLNLQLASLVLWPMLWALLASLALWPIKRRMVAAFEAYVASDMGPVASAVALASIPARAVGDTLRQVRRSYARRLAPLVRPMWLNMRKRGEGWRIAANFIASVLRLRDNGPLSRALGGGRGEGPHAWPHQHHHHHHHHQHTIMSPYYLNSLPIGEAPAAPAALVGPTQPSEGAASGGGAAMRRSTSKARLTRGQSMAGRGLLGEGVAAPGNLGGAGGRGAFKRPGRGGGGGGRDDDASGPSSASVSRSASPSKRTGQVAPAADAAPQVSDTKMTPVLRSPIPGGDLTSAVAPDDGNDGDSDGSDSSGVTPPPRSAYLSRRESDIGGYFHTDDEDGAGSRGSEGSFSDADAEDNDSEREGTGANLKRGGEGWGGETRPDGNLSESSDSDGDGFASDAGSEGEPTRPIFTSPHAGGLPRVHALRDDEGGPAYEAGGSEDMLNTIPRRRVASLAMASQGAGAVLAFSPVPEGLRGRGGAALVCATGASHLPPLPLAGSVASPSPSPQRGASPPPPAAPPESDDPPVSTLFWRVLGLSYLAYFIILYRHVCLLLLVAWVSLGATYGGTTFILSLTPVQAQVQRLLAAPEAWLHRHSASAAPSKGRRLLLGLWRSARGLATRLLALARALDALATQVRRHTLGVLCGWIESIVAVGLIAGVILVVSGATVFFTFKMVDEGVQAVAELRSLMSTVVDRSSSTLSFPKGRLPVLAYLAAASASFNATGSGGFGALDGSSSSGAAPNITGMVDSGVSWLVDRWPNETAIISELWRLAKEVDVRALQGAPPPTLARTASPPGAALVAPGLADAPLLTLNASAAPGNDSKPGEASPAGAAVVADGDATLLFTVHNGSAADADALQQIAATNATTTSLATPRPRCPVPDFATMRDEDGSPLDLSQRAMYVLASLRLEALGDWACWLEQGRAVFFPPPPGAASGGAGLSGANASGAPGASLDGPSPAPATAPSASAAAGILDRLQALLPGKGVGGVAAALGLPSWVTGSGSGTSGPGGQGGSGTAAAAGGAARGLSVGGAFGLLGSGGPFGGGNATVWSPLVSALRNATAALPSAADVARSSAAAVLYTVRAASLLTNYAIAASASLASFLLTLLLFLNLLFYLLSARTLWLESMFGFLPVDAQRRVLGALSSTVQQVFLINAKSCAFHALFTYLLLSVLDVHFVYTAVAASTIGAVIPFFPTVLVTVPAGIEVALKVGGYSGAAVGAGLVVFHWLVVGYSDWYFYADLPHGHPSVLGLSILAGMAAFGAAGAVVGPLIVSLLAAVFIIYTETVRRVAKAGSSGGEGGASEAR